MMEPNPQAFWMKFERVNREEWTGQKLDVTSWEDELSFMMWTLQALQGLSTVLLIILIAILVAGIMNTMWIAIRERTREIGTLRAIGMQRGSVARMFLVESLLLGLGGTIAGAVIGALIAAGLNALNIAVPIGVQLFLMSDHLFIYVPASPAGGGGHHPDHRHRPGRPVSLDARRPPAAHRGHGSLRLNLTHSRRYLAMNASRRSVLFLLAAATLADVVASSAALAAADKAKMVEILKVVDDRQRNSGDWRSLAYIEKKERGQGGRDLRGAVLPAQRGSAVHVPVHQAQGVAGPGLPAHRQEPVVLRPQRGQVGTADRARAHRRHQLRRSDFDESRLAEEYDPEFVAEEKLGAYTAIVMNLKGKPGIDLAFPTIKLWVDKDTNNVLKRQEFALSGKLLRTSYYPKWKKLYSESRKADIYYPEEIRIFDEVEKANQTLVLIKTVDLRPLEQNMFTKAWLESKSR